MPAQSMVDQGAFGGESFGGGASMFPGGGSMMGGRQVRLVLPRRPF